MKINFHNILKTNLAKIYRKEKTLIVRGADLTIKIAVKPKEDVPSEPENNTGEDIRENNTNENS